MSAGLGMATATDIAHSGEVKPAKRSERHPDEPGGRPANTGPSIPTERANGQEFV